jgi:hypothetical protein
MRMVLHAFAGEQGTDAHEVKLDLSRQDVQRYYAQKARERVGRYDFGKYVEVTDQQTGERWKIASAPCGEACHCAAVAVPLEEVSDAEPA